MKKIVKNFNNFVKKTIFIVKNKTNNNFKIITFNRYLLIFIGSISLYLFYLLIPLLYEKNWVQANIESKLLNEFKIKLSSSANISYHILPSPHFLIKDTKIIVNGAEKQRLIAEIKNLKVFLSQKNFFNKDKMSLKKVFINNANFIILRSDLKLLNKYNNSQFSNKKLKINNSIIFFKDHFEEIISIIKIKKASFFFDDQKLLNLFNLKGETYTIPFSLDFISQIDFTKEKKINFNAKSLKLNIFNQSIKQNDNSISGKSTISLADSIINTKYEVREKLIIFDSNQSKIKNSKVNYNGVLLINPFHLNLNIDLNNYKISKLSNINSVLIELIKSKLLFNDSISVNISITANSNIRNEIFQTAKINLHIINGKINFDNTEFFNNKIGSLKLSSSNLIFKNNKLVLNITVLINIKDSDNLFSFLNTNKTSRKKIQNILINLDYNFLNNHIDFNNVKIDNKEISNQLLTIISDFNDNNVNNFNKSRRLLNKMFSAYEG